MKRQASQVICKASKSGNAVRERQAATREAISLAKAQIKDGGMDDLSAINAACEQYPGASRSAVLAAIGEWT